MPFVRKSTCEREKALLKQDVSEKQLMYDELLLNTRSLTVFINYVMASHPGLSTEPAVKAAWQTHLKNVSDNMSTYRSFRKELRGGSRGSRVQRR